MKKRIVWQGYELPVSAESVGRSSGIALKLRISFVAPTFLSLLPWKESGRVYGTVSIRKP